MIYSQRGPSSNKNLCPTRLLNHLSVTKGHCKMPMTKRYSIQWGYWLQPVGFGIGILLYSLFFFPRRPLEFWSRLIDVFHRYPFVVVLFALVNCFLVSLEFVLIYTRLTSLLFPRTIEGELENCSERVEKQRGMPFAVRVAGEVHVLRFNQEAVLALRSLLGQRVRIAVGALKTVLSVEVIAERR